MSTNIIAAHRKAFDALITGGAGTFALVSCFVDDEAAAAIATIGRAGEEYLLAPLLVSITPRVALTDHDGVTPAVLAPAGRARSYTLAAGGGHG